MKQTLTIALAILGITFNLSPVHASDYTCKDIVAVSKLVAGGTTWTSSQTSYAHDVFREAEQETWEYLKAVQKAIDEGMPGAKSTRHLLVEKGLGGRLSIRDLTLKAIQRVHLAEARVASLGLNFALCISYGVGAYAAS